jgi:hypothetical protein
MMYPDPSLSRFDEEDEDFLDNSSRPGIRDDDSISRSTSRGKGDSGASVSTPSTTFLWTMRPVIYGTDRTRKISLQLMKLNSSMMLLVFLNEEQTPKIHAERTERNRRRGV